MSRADAVRAAMERHVTDEIARIGEDKAASAAHCVVIEGGEVVFDHAVGWRTLVPGPEPIAPDAIYDLASVTKIVSAATLLMRAVGDGRASLHTPIHEVLPQWAEVGGPTDATLLHLLNHSSGLPAWYKYYEELPFDPPDDDPDASTWEELRAQRDLIRMRAISAPREAAPGERYAYSDLGYITLAWALEELFSDVGEGLDEVAHKLIFEPLGMDRARYASRIKRQERVEGAVATERCSRRGIVEGWVHDENTYVMGGVSGHAGVFATAREVAAFGQHMLEIDQGMREGIVPRDVLHLCWSDATRGADGHHFGGWDTPSGARTSAGRGFDRNATVGHLGFTGTSLWIDRGRGVVTALLTNRVHPTRENPRILDLRIDVHEAVVPPTRTSTREPGSNA